MGYINLSSPPPIGDVTPNSISCDSFKLTSSPTSGYILTSDSSGNGTWQSSSGGVTSISGTANQIDASSSTGSVTLSLSDGISLGSYQSNTPPTGGMIIPGQVGFGTIYPFPFSSYTVNSNNSSLTYDAAFFSTLQNVSSAGIYLAQTFMPSSNSSSVSAIYSSPSFDTTNGTIGIASSIYISNQINSTPQQIDRVCGIYLDTTGGLNPGTPNICNIYAKNPGFGLVSGSSVSIYSDDMSVGYDLTSPPENGIIVSGAVGIGTSSPKNSLDVNGAISLGSYAGTTTAPSSGDIIMSGVLGIGNASPSYNIDILQTGGGVISVINVVAGTSASNSNASALVLGLQNSSNLQSNVSIVEQYQYNDGFNDYYGLSILSSDTLSLMSIPNSYLFVNCTPNNTSNALSVAGGTIIGSSGWVDSYIAPTNGLGVQGQFSLGTNDSSNNYGFIYGNTVQPVSDLSVYGWSIGGIISIPASTTQIEAINYYFNPSFDISASSAVIDVAFGMYLDAGQAPSPGSGSTITSATTLYVEQPNYGSDRYALNVQGGLILPNTAVTSTPYAVTTQNYFLSVSYTTTAAVTINLPSSVPAAGWACCIKDTAGNALVNNITIQSSGNVIDGASTKVINTNYGVAHIYSNGTQYYTF